MAQVALLVYVLNPLVVTAQVIIQAGVANEQTEINTRSVQEMQPTLTRPVRQMVNNALSMHLHASAARSFRKLMRQRDHHGSEQDGQ